MVLLRVESWLDIVVFMDKVYQLSNASEKNLKKYRQVCEIDMQVRILKQYLCK